MSNPGSESGSTPEGSGYEYPPLGPDAGAAPPPAWNPAGSGSPTYPAGPPNYPPPGYPQPQPAPYGYPGPGAGGTGYPAYPGTPGYPGQPGHPGQPGYPGYASVPGTNAMAIASLVSSVVALPLFFLFGVGVVGSVLGIVLGIVGLNQIPRSGESGKGLAIAGIVVGALGLVILLFAVLVLAVAANHAPY